MPEAKRVLEPPTANEQEIDAEIARYENLPIEKIREELHDQGIDPAPTVDAVHRLIESLGIRPRPARKR
jgi:hypothetical protein